MRALKAIFGCTLLIVVACANPGQPGELAPAPPSGPRQRHVDDASKVLPPPVDAEQPTDPGNFPLPPLDETSELMWSRLDRKVRNQVRKAEKSGVTVESGGVELLDDFYPVQQTAMLLINGKFADDRKTVTSFLKAYLRGVRAYVATLKDGKIAGPGAEDMIKDIAEMTGIKDMSLLHQMVPVFIDPEGARLRC